MLMTSVETQTLQSTGMGSGTDACALLIRCKLLYVFCCLLIAHDSLQCFNQTRFALLIAFRMVSMHRIQTTDCYAAP